ncbi:alpha/beta hydrolase family protein [Hymenobacter jejuensis]|uniref:Alpha/beta hydrolase n=1 Tax=Hymenobacter jejuensis TaxID=2502781 RepID=A0A5B8A0S3_9BACT|nr:alpha/beta hydrolase [Hymenobacter jejuensis]QDA60689.1 alpha/beta hydrolase [Hymenobacter jejuensis]
MALLAASGCTPDRPKLPLPTGHYEGTLTYQGTEARVALDMREPTPDHLQADFRFLEMGLSFPAQNLRFNAPLLHFEQRPGQKQGNMVVEAVQEGDFWRGNFKIDTLKADLLLVRRGKADPRPYREQPVRFRSGNLTLRGTLLLPNDTSFQHAAVVLLHGSSTPHQRDLYSYADLLARRGFAALVYDRRDAALPAGQLPEYSQEDLATDALAAVQALKKQPDIDSTHVGLWGISQGAHVAAIAASRPGRSVAFVVALSGPGVPYADVERFQNASRLREHDVSAKDMKQAAKAFDQLVRFVHGGGESDTTQLHETLTEAWQQPWAQYTTLPRRVPTPAEIKTQLRWRQLDLDPRAAWQQVKVPALLVYGSADERFDASESARRLRNVVGYKQGSTVKVYSGANHELMLPGGLTKEDKWEWPRPAPGFVDDMLGWMRARTAQ